LHALHFIVCVKNSQMTSVLSVSLGQYTVKGLLLHAIEYLNYSRQFVRAFYRTNIRLVNSAPDQSSSQTITDPSDLESCEEIEYHSRRLTLHSSGARTNNTLELLS
jgi:hypothetical protein